MKRSTARANLDRAWGEAMRPYVAELARPEWPVWPEDVGADVYAWVRAHWTVEASDEFDLHLEQDFGLLDVEREELCFHLIDRRDDPEAVRETLSAWEYPLWPDEYEPPWYTWYMHWPPAALASLSPGHLDFLLRMHAALYVWRDDTPASYQRQSRRRRMEHEAKWARPRGELLAELREHRTWGARGCYRLMGSQWEDKHGLTAADVDAP